MAAAVPVLLLIVVVLVALLGGVVGHGSVYLPGVSPNSVKEHDVVPLYVAQLTSTKTQIPYDYYKLPYCRPKHLHLQSENLGESISGDRIEDSVFKIEAKDAKTCEVACSQRLSNDQRKAFKQAIDDEYRVHWLLDSLPVGMYSATKSDVTQDIFVRGFPVGFKLPNGKGFKYYLNNHIRIIVDYHDDAEVLTPGDLTTKIVGFRVEPMSIKHSFESAKFIPGATPLTTCNQLTPAKSDPKTFLDINGDKSEVIFTYDVVWSPSNTEWTNRWDLYLTVQNPEEKVHWFSITNAVMVILLLTVLIAVIFVRAIRRDIAKYNDSNRDDAGDESGWKLVHADVFRPPVQSPMLLSVFVGTGVQLCTMGFFTLSFCLLGLLSPANRGSLGTAFILLFVFMGSFAGYFSSSTYKMFRGIQWSYNSVATAIFFPGVVFLIVGALNCLMMYEGSSAAIPLNTFLTLLFLWFCVSVPLVFIGSFFAYKKEQASFPVRTNQIPRAIPDQPWFMNPILIYIFGGILPFGAVSVELYFIMSALWLHQIYYIFGFLMLCMVILFITVAETSILLCYLQLCNEDYRWWWRSFITSGSCAFYTMIYSVWYNMTELSLSGLAPQAVYFGYMTLICFTFFLITGTIGFFACFWFNIQIYGSIKVD
jgi:transmembrane 9 superfamily protein 2/4